MKYLGYIRQSRERDSDISPETQKAEIEHWAAAPGKARQVKFLKPDRDFSGKSLERPAMQEALRLLRLGAADGIVVAKLDRLTRSVRDLANLIEEMRGSKWTIICLDLGGETVDFSTKTGKLVGYMSVMFAEWYLDGVTEEWTKVRRHKIEVQGAHWGAPPLGYDRGVIVNGKGVEQPGALEPNEWAGAVQEVFRRKAAGASWADLALYLTEAGAPSLRERAAAKREEREECGSAWSPTSLKSVVENRAYLGEARAGELVRADAHPALVDARLFRRANRKGVLHGGERRDGPLLGGGFCKCGSCGRSLVRSTQRQNGKRYGFYRCNSPHCTERVSVSQTRLEVWAIEEAFRRMPDLAAEIPAEDDEVARLENELGDLERELAATDEDERAGALSVREAGRVRTALEVQREKLEAELAAAAPAVGGEGGWQAIPPDRLRDMLFEKIEGGVLGDEVREVARDTRTARGMMREVLGGIEVAPGRGAIETRVRLLEEGATLAA